MTTTPTTTKKPDTKKGFQATLTRQPSTDAGTFGVLVLGELKLHTAELPWHDNAPRISCIPTGEYQVVPHTSPRLGRCFQVQDVEDRGEILIHRGNWAGDNAKGYKSDVLGCILVGLHDLDNLEGQRGVSGSGPALAQLLDATGGDGFTLTIE